MQYTELLPSKPFGCCCLIATLGLVAMGTGRCTKKKMYDVGGGPQAARTQPESCCAEHNKTQQHSNPQNMANSWSLCSLVWVLLLQQTHTHNTPHGLHCNFELCPNCRSGSLCFLIWLFCLWNVRHSPPVVISPRSVSLGYSQPRATRASKHVWMGSKLLKDMKKA